MKEVFKGKKLTGYTAYLNNIEKLTTLKCVLKNPAEVSIEMLDEMMQVRAAYEISQATKELQESKLPNETVWNEQI